MVEAAKPVNNANASNLMRLMTAFAKPLPDVSKIEVFTGENFRR